MLVTLKRFEFDMFGTALSKIDTRVRCELDDLDVSPMMCGASPAPPAPRHYRLVGWLEHMGSSARGGHYVSARVVRNVRTGAATHIVHYDDERVRVERARIDDAGVCAAACGAYMLCYEHV